MDAPIHFAKGRQTLDQVPVERLIGPAVVIDVREKCPHGVSSITEETTFDNGLAGFFTLGIWSPRQTTYHCETAK